MKKIMFVLIALVATMFASCNGMTDGSVANTDSTTVDSLSADTVMVDTCSVDTITE